MPRDSWIEPDLEYRSHFIGSSGVIEGLQLFSARDDEAAAQDAREQLRERTNSRSVELWKRKRLIARYLSDR